jgi:hypothetical protein
LKQQRDEEQRDGREDYQPVSRNEAKAGVTQGKGQISKQSQDKQATPTIESSQAIDAEYCRPSFPVFQ